MKYCKNCGAELAEGVSFCEKCGNPVGHSSKTEEGKKGKTLLLAILAGLIVVAVGTVGVLFGTGVLGNKEVKEAAVVKDGNETDAVAQETSDAAEEKDSVAETDSAPAVESSKSELAERAWKAYSAYIKELRPAIEAYAEYNKTILDYGAEDGEWDEWDGSEYYFPVERCDGYYALFYMDSDDYPELLCGMANPVLLTYKDGEVRYVYYDRESAGEKDEYMEDEYTEHMSFPLDSISSGHGFSCRERQNSLYVWEIYASGGGSSYDYFYSLEDNNCLKRTWYGEGRGLNEAWDNPEERVITSNGSTDRVTGKEYNERLAKQKVDDYSWLVLEERDESDRVSGKTIFEAWYTFTDRNHFYAN